MMEIRYTHWMLAVLLSVAAHVLLVELIRTPGTGGAGRGTGVSVRLGAHFAASDPIAIEDESVPSPPSEISSPLAAVPVQSSQPPAALKPSPAVVHTNPDFVAPQNEISPETVATEAVTIEAATDAPAPPRLTEHAPGVLEKVQADSASTIVPGEVAAAKSTATYPSPAEPSDSTVARSGGATSGTSIGTDPGRADDYYAELAAWLGRHKRYPRSARNRGHEGTVEIEFVIDRRGRLLHRRIVISSGIEVLDDEAFALIRRAAPMPPIPPELDSESLTVTAPITFSLR